MKKLIAFVTVMLICVTLACPAFAAENEFVPSISYKDEPVIVPVEDENGDPAIGVIRDSSGDIISYIYEDCLVVTSIANAKTSTEIPEDARELLLSVYEQLTNGTMTLPYPDGATNMVIRDLYDASFLCTEHPEMLKQEGVTLDITFDLGISADTELVVMTYIDGKWAPIVNVLNNGDGTVTCTFEDICPIAFSVRSAEIKPPVQTGDYIDLAPWFILMAVSAAALVVLLVANRRKSA